MNLHFNLRQDTVGGLTFLKRELIFNLIFVYLHKGKRQRNSAQMPDPKCSVNHALQQTKVAGRAEIIQTLVENRQSSTLMEIKPMQLRWHFHECLS